jgi:hypothetical protein
MVNVMAVNDVDERHRVQGKQYRTEDRALGDAAGEF